jgi:hypothetical protein
MWPVLLYVSKFKSRNCAEDALGKQYKKGKAIPLQAWTGPDRSRRFRLPDFKTVGTWRW